LLEDDDEGWVEGDDVIPVLGAAKTLADADGELAHLTMEGEHLNAEFNV
jgi:hypothetical protein